MPKMKLPSVLGATAALAMALVAPSAPVSAKAFNPSLATSPLSFSQQIPKYRQEGFQAPMDLAGFTSDRLILITSRYPFYFFSLRRSNASYYTGDWNLMLATPSQTAPACGFLYTFNRLGLITREDTSGGQPAYVSPLDYGGSSNRWNGVDLAADGTCNLAVAVTLLTPTANAGDYAVAKVKGDLTAQKWQTGPLIPKASAKTVKIKADALGRSFLLNEDGSTLTVYPVSASGTALPSWIAPGTDLAVDDAGNIYVVNGSSLQAYTLSGQTSGPVYNIPNGNACSKIAFDVDGKLWAINAKQSDGYVFVAPSPTPTQTTVCSATPTKTPNYSPTPTPTPKPTMVYVVDGSQVHTYNGTWNTGAYAAIPTSNPLAVTFDDSGTIYVADGSSGSIYTNNGGSWSPVAVPASRGLSGLGTDGTSHLVVTYNNASGAYTYVIFSLPGLTPGSPAPNSGATKAAGFGGTVWVSENQTLLPVVGSGSTLALASAPQAFAMTSASGGFYCDSGACYTTAGQNLNTPVTTPLGCAADATGAFYVSGLIAPNNAAVVYKYSNGSWSDLNYKGGAVPYGIAIH